MTRIVLIVPRFPKLSETFIVSKFLELLGRGYDVHVVCQRSEAHEWARYPQLQSRPELRQRIHAGWPSRPRWLASILVPVAFARCILRSPISTVMYIIRGMPCFGLGILRWLYLDAELILLKPDLIHFEFGALAVNRMHVRKLLNCKVITSFRGHDLNFTGLDDPDYYTDVWAQVDGVHCLGLDLWLCAQQRGCPESILHALIPPAINGEYFNPGKREFADKVGTPRRPLRVLSVGRLNWTKGYEYALLALKLLQESGLAVEYRIVGDGEELEAIAFCRHQLDLEGIVSLMGPLSSDGVRKQMLWADILLHSALSEGFCNVVLEAQAMGLPVVATDANGLPENVVDSVTGFVVPRRDPQALVEKMVILASDATLRERMGQAGRQRVLTSFNLAAQTNNFESLYLRALNLARE